MYQQWSEAPPVWNWSSRWCWRIHLHLNVSIHSKSERMGWPGMERKGTHFLPMWEAVFPVSFGPTGCKYRKWRGGQSKFFWLPLKCFPHIVFQKRYRQKRHFKNKQTKKENKSRAVKNGMPFEANLHSLAYKKCMHGKIAQREKGSEAWHDLSHCACMS